VQWIAIDAKVRGKTFRFVTSHLESFSAVIQELQAGELLSRPTNTALPVVLSGEFNSNANGLPGLPDDTATYPDLIAAGFEDAWTAVSSDVGNVARTRTFSTQPPI
jgi:endonuclease/exonuclease/phosphatase family metal-dependent hydrolase